MPRAARRAPRSRSRFVVLTGLSGSGKSQAIRALEDLGYFCVDNLPVALLPMLAELTLRAGSEIARAAVVVDVREGRLLKDFPGDLPPAEGDDAASTRCSSSSRRPNAALVRRFSETRRPHPLAPDRSAIEGIREERQAMKADAPDGRPRRRHAAMTVHELRHVVHRRRERPRAGHAARRHDPELRLQARHSGRRRPGVRRAVPAQSALRAGAAAAHGPRPRGARATSSAPTATHDFLEHTLNLLKFLIPQYVAEGKTYLTIGIGCTGGRHRSVAMAEALKKGLSGLDGHPAARRATGTSRSTEVDAWCTS